MTTSVESVAHRSDVKRYVCHDKSVNWHAICQTCRWSSGLKDTREEATAAAEAHRFPALQLLLADEHPGGWPDYGPGAFCPECPFRDPALSYQERDGSPIDNDPTEAHYDCNLLGRKEVWGEYSPCTEADWKARARAELAEMRKP